jgi:hypothetical protein
VDERNDLVSLHELLHQRSVARRIATIVRNNQLHGMSPEPAIGVLRLYPGLQRPHPTDERPTNRAGERPDASDRDG